MRFPDFLGILAEGLVGLGRLAEAHVTIEEAIERVEPRRGVLVSCRAPSHQLEEATAQSSAAVEDRFVGAIDLAREQSAFFGSCVAP